MEREGRSRRVEQSRTGRKLFTNQKETKHNGVLIFAIIEATNQRRIKREQAIGLITFSLN